LNIGWDAEKSLNFDNCQTEINSALIKQHGRCS
jgi:hypothetical protein